MIKRRFKIIGLIGLSLILILIFTSCDSGGTLKVTKFDVNVNVLDSESEDSIAGAEVTLGEKNVNTDSSGTAIFKSVEKGQYKLSATAESYQNFSEGFITVNANSTNFYIKMILASNNITVTGGSASITLDPDTNVEQGETVTVTISEIQSGKQFKSITITDSENAEVETNEVIAGQEYTFIMPAGSISVTLKLEESEFAGGAGTSADPWIIQTANQLNNVRNYLGKENKDKHFKLNADINLGVSPWNEGEGWKPIGDESERFLGNLLGDNHKIIGMTIDRPEEGYIGLFGFIEDATLQDIVIQGHQIKGKEFLGALAGYMKEGEVIEVHVEGNVISEDSSGRNIAGLIGYNERGLICSSSARGNVTGKSFNVAGLVGENRGVIKDSYSTDMTVIGDSSSGGLVGRSYPYASYESGITTWDETTGIIENCYTTSSVIVNSNRRVGGLLGDNSGGYDGNEINGKVIKSYSNANVTGLSRVGGLIGANSGIVKESFGTGRVIGEGDYNGEIGGFTGYNYGYIYNSYSSGNVEGRDQVGGFAGRNTDDIINSYSLGKVIGEETRVGGFLGHMQSGNVVECFWDIDQAEMSYSAAGTGLSTTDMINEETFPAGWDFVSIWTIDENQSYPYLQWQDNYIPLPSR